jgi:eukaryotic-like serine/threonine-protein kinase
MVDNTAESFVGCRLGGRYQITRLIGQGGMGAVFEGEHVEIGKRVAIKLLFSFHSNNPEVLTRFKREARSASAVESEHIIQVFDVGQDERCGLFLVMELLRGMDLAWVLSTERGLDPHLALGVAIQAARGLSKTHDAGVVHRDLKPANLFLSVRDDGAIRVKLVDFGIAKIIRDANQTGAGLTRTGSVMGTAQYMSPEQAQGLPSVDHRTDIFSLGAVIFEMIAGTAPVPEFPTFEQTIIYIATHAPRRISELMPDIDPAIDGLVAWMMSPDPAARPQSMHDVRRALDKILPDLEGMRLFLPGVAAAAGIRTIRPPGLEQPSTASRMVPAAALPSGLHGALPSQAGTHSAVALEGGSEPDEPVSLPVGRAPIWIIAGAAGVLIAVIGTLLVLRLGGRSRASTDEASGKGLVAASGNAVAASSPPPPASVSAFPTAPLQASATPRGSAVAPGSAPGKATVSVTTPVTGKKGTAAGAPPTTDGRKGSGSSTAAGDQPGSTTKSGKMGGAGVTSSF